MATFSGCQCPEVWAENHGVNTNMLYTAVREKAVQNTPTFDL